jgi:hypothetical protein
MTDARIWQWVFAGLTTGAGADCGGGAGTYMPALKE